MAWRPRNTDFSTLDNFCLIPDQEAISLCRKLARDTGILLGGSGGLVLFGALAWLNKNYGDSALAIIPDSGFNYLDQFYDDTWLEKKSVTVLSSKEIKNRIQKIKIFNIKNKINKI